MLNILCSIHLFYFPLAHIHSIPILTQRLQHLVAGFNLDICSLDLHQELGFCRSTGTHRTLRLRQAIQACDARTAFGYMWAWGIRVTPLSNNTATSFGSNKVVSYAIAALSCCSSVCPEVNVAKLDSHSWASTSSIPSWYCAIAEDILRGYNRLSKRRLLLTIRL